MEFKINLLMSNALMLDPSNDQGLCPEIPELHPKLNSPNPEPKC